MILYLDTSSLVKLYVKEQGSEEARGLASGAEVITTSWLAYTEARSALARKYRGRGLTEDEYRQALREFEKDWDIYAALEVSPGVLREAGDLAEKHGLRSLDAIHLASAVSVLRRSEPADLIFSSVDLRLVAAAEVEGLSCARG